MGDTTLTVTRQPVKAIYTLYFVLSLVVRLPYYMLKYVVPSARPRPNWTYKASLLTQITRLVFSFMCEIRVHTERSLDSGKEADRFQLVDKAPSRLFSGLPADSQIQATQIGGIWNPKPLDSSKGVPSRVVLHFHGGGYVLLSPRLPTAQYGPKMLCAELPADATFCPQYRLASNPEGMFPAQLQDAIAAYHFLLDKQKIEPSRIVLSGDSAGGHLVLSLLRYLKENPGLLPLPKAALLHSPWLNMTASGTNVEKIPNAQSDFLSSALLKWGAEAFTPPNADKGSEYMSPVFHPFSTEVPIWTQAGTAEIFHGDIAQWVSKMKELPGNVIELYEAPDAMHDIFASAGDFGMDEAALCGVRDASAFLDRVG